MWCGNVNAQELVSPAGGFLTCSCSNRAWLCSGPGDVRGVVQGTFWHSWGFSSPQAASFSHNFFFFFFFFSREEGFSFLVSIIVISSTDYLYIILVSFLSGLTVVKGLCCHNSAFFCNTDGVDPVQTLPQVIFTCSNTPRTYLSFTESKMAQNVMPRRPIAHYSILLITK